MKKRKIIADFLFPADKKTTCAVRPGMAALDHPTPRAAAASTFYGFLALARHVQNVLQTLRQLLRPFRHIAFVQTKMLFATAQRLRPAHGHRKQRGAKQLEIMGVCGGNGHADRHAASVGHDRSLHAQLTAIRRVFTGFFPRPAAILSSRRPPLATATRCRVAHRRFANIFSRSGKKCGVDSIPGSNDERCSARRIAAAAPSIDSRYARDKEFHQRLAGDLPLGVRLCGYVGTLAGAAPIAATFFPAFAQNDYTNRNAYSPPCVEQVTFLSCSTLAANFSSVLG